MKLPRRSLAYGWVLFVSSLLPGCRSLEQPKPAASIQRVPWNSIGGDTVIIGKLGIPLGVTTEIEATVVAGRLADPQLPILGCVFKPHD